MCGSPRESDSKESDTTVAEQQQHNYPSPGENTSNLEQTGLRHRSQLLNEDEPLPLL